MSKTFKVLIGFLAAAAFSAGAQAGAIQLETSQPTQMKFSDYEIGLRPDAQGSISFGGATYSLVSGAFQVGDKLVGLANITSIGTTSQPNALSTQLSTTQLTGVFSLTITNCDTTLGCSSTTTATNSHMDFALGTGDFIRLYTGVAGTMDPTLYTGTSASLTNAVNSAMGTSWLEVNGSASNSITLAALAAAPAYVGYSNSSSGTLAATINDNWANADVNNTGYTLVPQLWPGTNYTLSGDTVYCETGPCPSPNSYTTIGALGLLSQVWFQSQLNFNTNTGTNGSWQFISQDPLLLYTVPDPATLLLLGTGLIGLGLFTKKRLST